MATAARRAVETGIALGSTRAVAAAHERASIFGRSVRDCGGDAETLGTWQKYNCSPQFIYYGRPRVKRNLSVQQKELRGGSPARSGADKRNRGNGARFRWGGTGDESAAVGLGVGLLDLIRANPPSKPCNQRKLSPLASCDWIYFIENGASVGITYTPTCCGAAGDDSPNVSGKVHPMCYEHIMSSRCDGIRRDVGALGRAVR